MSYQPIEDSVVLESAIPQGTVVPIPENDGPVEDLVRAWEQYAPEISQYCLRSMGGHYGDAEEALSRTSWNAFRSYRDIQEPKAWLFKIASNCCIDIHRERKRRAEESLSEDVRSHASALYSLGVSRSATPELELLRAERRHRLEAAIESLPDAWREVILRRLDGHSARTIATDLGISEANVRKRAQLARESLRHRLES